MSKKGRSMVDYYGFLGVAYRLMDSIRSLAIADLIFFAFFLFGGSFFGGVIFMQTFLAGMVMAVELIILSHLKFYELRNSTLFGNKKQLNCSTKEIVQLLSESKEVFAEVKDSECKDIYKKLDFARHELVKVICCKNWILRTEEESDAFCRIKTTVEQDISFLVNILAQKDVLFCLFDTDLELQNLIMEQYNRVKRKVLEWPKVISK